MAHRDRPQRQAPQGARRDREFHRGSGPRHRFPVAHPSDAAGWTRLLQEYKPGRRARRAAAQALQQLTGRRPRGNGPIAVARSFTVLSLSSDPGALALGPQLAVFAASLGIPTALVIGPQQDVNAAATLRTACAVRTARILETAEPSAGRRL